MDNKSILNKVAYILRNDTTLKAYVEKVFIGDREMIYGDTYPCIVLDTPDDPLNNGMRGNIVENLLKINIYPAILVTDREKALIGGTSAKGILDFIEDIKTALYVYYPDLARNCLDFQLSVNQIADFEDMKGKFAVIEMKVLYRETI